MKGNVQLPAHRLKSVVGGHLRRTPEHMHSIAHALPRGDAPETIRLEQGVQGSPGSMVPAGCMRRVQKAKSFGLLPAQALELLSLQNAACSKQTGRKYPIKAICRGQVPTEQNEHLSLNCSRKSSFCSIGA